MRRLFAGSCCPTSIFEIRDPSAPSEIEFESWAVKGIACTFQDYACVTFSGMFVHEGRSFRPDLAMVARDFSHWFVIEVELTSHSFSEHVLPQIRAFRYGEPVPGCEVSLAAGLNISTSQARTLLERVPYGVAVVLNMDNPQWVTALKAHDVQVLVVSAYTSMTGLEAIEVSGVLEVVRESLGFGEYIASFRSVRFGTNIRLPSGRIQIRDLHGTVAWWTVRKDGSDTWVTKEVGTPDIDDRRTIQIIGTGDGYLAMR